MQGDFRIGECLIHPRLNSLERDGEIVHLEPKVMQVLLTLAAEPGEVVTREKVRSAVWPDVFVGEDVLIRAISEIRRAFADDPRSPHTIQTVPKVGYRLIAPVSELPASEMPLAEADSFGSRGAQASDVSTMAQDVPDRASRRSGLFWIALAGSCLLVACLVGIAFAVHVFERPRQTETYTSRPLTTYPGSELRASFSPDGSAIAFVWRKENEGNGHIYIKFLASEAPVRLTSGDADETSPAWSPDGHLVAFIRQNDQRSTVVIEPAVGGSEQEVYTLPAHSVWEYGGLVWTADGEHLIFPQLSDAQPPSTLVELSLKDRSVRTLTSPPKGWDGDWSPAISPDGKELAFVRGPSRSSLDIYVMSLPDGRPRQLTHDGRLIVGLTWTADGSSIVFSSNRGGSVSLWRVAAGGGTPEHEPAGGDDAYSPAIAKQGDRMVYSHGSAIWNIVSAGTGDKSTDASTDILTSSEQDSSPHVSPSGDTIAFQSWRSGAQEIWTAAIDGSNLIQLTSTGASAGSPSWSPDGKLLGFDARPDSFSHLFVIDAAGGSPRQVTRGDYNDIVPSWSADGRWLYFGSNRSGSWQIWKTAANGSGAPQQITTNGGMVALESSDGASLYYTKFESAGIWQRPVGAGVEREVFDGGPPTGSPDYWTLHDGKLYSLAVESSHAVIDEIDPATGHRLTIHVLKHSPTLFAGLSLTPDGKHVLLAELQQASSDLMLVEHYQ